MKVRVLAKRKFNKLMVENQITDENVESRDLVAFVSINDTSGKRARHFQNEHANVIIFHFDDVENDGETSPTNIEPTTRAFTIEDARRLVEFVKKNRHVDTFTVHCEAGISRSGAVGQFINDYMGGYREIFESINPNLAPNAKVQRLLNQAWREDNQRT